MKVFEEDRLEAEILKVSKINFVGHRYDRIYCPLMLLAIRTDAFYFF